MNLRLAFTDFHIASQDFQVILADWFLSHLHDPYPTKDEKDILSQRTGAPLKRVEAWMSDARRSTGWTTVCQELFDGSRKKASQVARDFYISYLSKGAHPSDASHAFLVVKFKAEKLLSDAEEQVMTTAGYQPLVTLAKVDALPGLVVEEKIGFKYSGGTWLSTDEQHVSPEEEEDTTPPPPVAGAKRRRTDEPVFSKRPRYVLDDAHNQLTVVLTVRSVFSVLRLFLRCEIMFVQRMSFALPAPEHVIDSLI
jgi:hypothetical protein